jgi:hypothetical protein
MGRACSTYGEKGGAYRILVMMAFAISAPLSG